MNRRIKQLSRITNELQLPRTKRLLMFFGIVLIGVLAGWVTSETTDYPLPVAYMTGILFTAAFLWATEIIPLFATSLLIIGTQIILLGNPGDWSILQTPGIAAIPYQSFLAPLADPIIYLFLGGFILAKVGVKVNVDVYLSSAMLRIFGLSAKSALLGVIVCTTIFGMWISNTATTAMMITLTASLLAFVPAGNSFRKGLTLAIPFSASIGGLMTPIGSPPNAIAVGLLAKEGVQIDFLTWMVIMFPLVLILLFILFQLLWYRYKPEEPLMLTPVETKPFGGEGIFVIVVFTITVLLWLTDSLHGIPSAVVALFPAIMFTATGLLSVKEFNRLEWNILFVIAGGLALGQGMNLTGLDKVIANSLPLESEWIVLIIFTVTLVVGTFMSNTTTAILFIPMAMSMAQQLDGVNMKFMALGLAVMAGSSMALPISTPPNAIAYSTGELTSKDFIINGVVIGICSLFITYLYFWLLTYFGFW
ncbi:DASS family sodium-coupled anion symporter [Pontibacter sp. HSC-36F09]|uniref:SLC13 family permease n=1 Tax=Pontibacter sp. HSC-36F09 TaxID=2910966 RepID=UPI0020A1DC44|nr:DASS family sodium-coupled anion symporter [Pontibacter sp. HSC-36F09]MCP2043330.1 sodium-dependent dicarboxylate transporter 2/3/5 [Pontibacter sp. HSC-36F09]